VDLIDAGSVPGLKEGTEVGIEYEGGSPRRAYVQHATRSFVAKNIAGIGIQGVLCLLVLVVFVMGAHYLGKAWNRLVVRR